MKSFVEPQKKAQINLFWFFDIRKKQVQRRIYNFVEHLWWSFLWRYVMA